MTAREHSIMYLIVSGFIFQLHTYMKKCTYFLCYAYTYCKCNFPHKHLLQEFYVYVYAIFNYAVCSQNGKTFFKITFILTTLITFDFYELLNEYLWPTYITYDYIHIGTYM